MENKKAGDKINIALVCTSMNQLGGKNVHLSNMYRYFDKDKFNTCIIGCSKVENELKNFMLQRGVKEEDLILVPRFKKWLLIPLILRLRKAFIVKKIDIVHTFQVQSDILGGLVARLAGVKHLISQYESKIIEDNISVLKQFFYKISNKLIKNWFKKTVVVSEGLKRELISEEFRPMDSIEVIQLGLKLPDVYKEIQFSFNNLREGRPLIGTIARLSKEKGIDRFIMAIPLILKEIPQAQFVIVGEGEENENLIKQIGALKISSRIAMKEWTEAVYAVLETIDIFVMPSVREGCPAALLEALALARPVVASDIEGIRDIIEDNKNGILVDTTNTKLFAERIIFLCKNPEKAIGLGAAGQQKVLANFTIESEMEKVKRLYIEVLN